MMRRELRWVWQLPRRALVGLARLYQVTLSPLVGRQCKYLPTCSSYFIEAVQKKGAVVGTLKGLWRICRCNPFAAGGYDPVEPEKPDRESPGLGQSSLGQEGPGDGDEPLDEPGR
ncbi:MAG: membrane protein insertion efficiency factor YidD [Phycisphaerae bacterium]